MFSDPQSLTGRCQRPTSWKRSGFISARLLPEPDKPYGGIRRYGPADVARVRFVNRPSGSALRWMRLPTCSGSRTARTVMTQAASLNTSSAISGAARGPRADGIRVISVGVRLSCEQRHDFLPADRVASTSVVASLSKVESIEPEAASTCPGSSRPMRAVITACRHDGHPSAGRGRSHAGPARRHIRRRDRPDARLATWAACSMRRRQMLAAMSADRRHSRMTCTRCRWSMASVETAL